MRHQDDFEFLTLFLPTFPCRKWYLRLFPFRLSVSSLGSSPVSVLRMVTVDWSIYSKEERVGPPCNTCTWRDRISSCWLGSLRVSRKFSHLCHRPWSAEENDCWRRQYRTYILQHTNRAVIRRLKFYYAYSNNRQGPLTNPSILTHPSFGCNN